MKQAHTNTDTKQIETNIYTRTNILINKYKNTEKHLQTYTGTLKYIYIYIYVRLHGSTHTCKIDTNAKKHTDAHTGS